MALLFILFHKKNVQLAAQVCCLSYFTFYFVVHLSKEK